jgi:CO/xanthine dehydrogenase Mo-binding subunit
MTGEHSIWHDAPMPEPSPAMPPVGQSVPRVDGVAKVTGRARYLDDLDAPGAWHGATVRSTVAHGVLEAIDLDPGFDWSRVVVVTAADIPGLNTIRLIEDDQPALVRVGAEVMHVDEAIALVAAPTKALAAAAAAAVKPRITTLPTVFTVEDSLAAKTRLYGADNVFKQFVIRKGHTDRPGPRRRAPAGDCATRSAPRTGSGAPARARHGGSRRQPPPRARSASPTSAPGRRARGPRPRRTRRTIPRCPG